jgi:erythromycin esterase-like protein
MALADAQGHDASLSKRIRDAALPLPALDDPAFADAFERFADAKVVLLGEASHGTSEFYRARAAITLRLVERHGFNVVGLEADWPDAAALDRHVRGREGPRDGPPFKRFPLWMWRNAEMAGFVSQLRALNASRPFEERAEIRGLDLYSLNASISAVLEHLDESDPTAARSAPAATAACALERTARALRRQRDADRAAPARPRWSPS